MFTGFMINTWAAATIVAVIGGAVGFFVVLRGSAFAAHAIPKGAFAGAAGASLLGVSTLIGLAAFALLGALGIGSLGRRGRHDAVTALALVMMLALGAAFLSRTTEYEPEIYSLLFGEVLGVSTTEILPIALLAVACITAVIFLYRPLMLASVVPEIGETRGVRSHRMEICFLIVLAAATALTLPVVGALLIFSLMTGPPAAARSITSRPLLAISWSIAIAVITVWAAIACSYLLGWPAGFFVGAFGALAYAIGRGWAGWHGTQRWKWFSFLGRLAIPCSRRSRRSPAPMSESAMPASDADDRVPVTVLTGFLGSGKTTLLNRILTEEHGMRIAVVENEFGEVGIDDALVLGAEEEVFEMNNGCICCTVRGDLIRILGALMRRRDKFDRILIETTGLADPAPVAQTFFMDDEIAAQLRLDAIITMVDAAHALTHLNEVKPDGVENEAVEQVAFADRIVLNKTDLAGDPTIAQLTDRIRSVNATAQIIPAQHAKIDLREVLDVGAFDLDRVLVEDPQFLDQADHQHDLSVTSVGIDLPGGLDGDRVNAWLGNLLRTKGIDIFRSKGILAIAGAPRQYVFQGVHMLLDGGFGREWGADEPRNNRLVFIGRNLDRAELERGFAGCLAAVKGRR